MKTQKKKQQRRTHNSTVNLEQDKAPTPTSQQRMR